MHVTVVLATVGFTANKVHPVVRSAEAKEELVLFHDKDAEGRSKQAAREAAAYARNLGMEVQLYALDAFDLVACCQRIRGEIRKRADKDVVVSIAGGTRVLGSAALLASILEGVRVVHVNEDTGEPQPLPLLKLRADEVLNGKQRAVLRWVHDHPGCMQRDLGEALKLTKGTVSHHIRKLKEQGLVEAEAMPGDARSERLRAVPSADLLLMA